MHRAEPPQIQEQVTRSTLHHHPQKGARWTSLRSRRIPPTADMGIGDRWIRFVDFFFGVGVMGKNLEETEEEKAERVAAEAEKRIAEAKRKDM